MTDLIDRWCELRELGVYTIDSAAVRLGVDRDTLRTALRRAHRAGDPRVPEMPKAKPVGDDLNTSAYTSATCRVDENTKAAARRMCRRHAKSDHEYAEFCEALGIGTGDAA